MLTLYKLLKQIVYNNSLWFTVWENILHLFLLEWSEDYFLLEILKLAVFKHSDDFPLDNATLSGEKEDDFLAGHSANIASSKAFFFPFCLCIRLY